MYDSQIILWEFPKKIFFELSRMFPWRQSQKKTTKATFLLILLFTNKEKKLNYGYFRNDINFNM